MVLINIAFPSYADEKVQDEKLPPPTLEEVIADMRYMSDECAILSEKLNVTKKNVRSCAYYCKKQAKKLDGRILGTSLSKSTMGEHWHGCHDQYTTFIEYVRGEPQTLAKSAYGCLRAKCCENLQKAPIFSKNSLFE